ncbi:MAG: Dyp-type peroxidase [Chromatiales bacterium]|nr:Dyp-type peroxidase [Chromatiales bacterium]
MRPQSAIIHKSGPHSLFLTFKVKDRSKKLAQAIADLDPYIANVKKFDRVYSAISFGEAYWKHITPSSDGIPEGIRTFNGIEGDYPAPATGGDIFLHLNGKHADLNYEVAWNWLQSTKGGLEVIHEQACARYLDERDIIGFIDGTENPESSQERKKAALIKASADSKLLTASSFVFVQTFQHKIAKWNALTTLDQEYVIGRTKEASLELAEDRKPPTAHISRVVIEEDGEELEIVRHSLQYFKVRGSKGLVFVAYTRDLDIIEKMLARMFGTADEFHDKLMEYTTPITGAMFFTPSKELLDLIKKAKE